MAVGYRGVVATSPDGATWTKGSLGTDTLYSLTWAATRWVGVGNKGAVQTSPDGVTWTKRNSGTQNQLLSVVWTGGLLVAVGQAGKILVSADGTEWDSVRSGTTEWLYGVSRVGDQLIAVGGGGTILTTPLDPTGIVLRRFPLRVPSKSAETRFIQAETYKLNGARVFDAGLQPIFRSR